MSLIHLVTGGAEITRRRKLVPAGRLVEAWPDVGRADHFWVGSESKALLDAATGEPLPAGLSLDGERVPVFYGARLRDIESLPTEESLRARVLSGHGIAVAWITLDVFGERTEHEPRSLADPIFFLRRPRGEVAHVWRLFRSRPEAITYMREHYGTDAEGPDWAERLRVHDYAELIGRAEG
jgi:hypothetical protein